MIQPRNHTADKRNLNWRVFLLPSLRRVSGGEICHVICHKAESKEAGKYANASDSLSLPRDERSVRYFIFLLSFPIFYQFITRFWSGPWALCFGRIHHSSICWPVPMTFLYYIVIRLVIFNFFHHLWLLLLAFSTFVLRRSSIQRDLLARECVWPWI